MSVGAMAGVLLGGAMFDWVGSDTTFRIFCIANAISAGLLWCLGSPEFEKAQFSDIRKSREIMLEIDDGSQLEKSKLKIRHQIRQKPRAKRQNSSF